MKSLRIVDRIENWPIDRLSASVKKPRKQHSQHSAQIAASRLEFGDVYPFWSIRMKPDCWAWSVGPESPDGSKGTRAPTLSTTGLRNMLIAVKSVMKGCLK